MHTWARRVPRLCPPYAFDGGFTLRTRRMRASSSSVIGCASGSDKAAAITSSSVIASSLAQSVLPRGSGSPFFTVTRVIRVLLMSVGDSAEADVHGVYHNHRRHRRACPGDPRQSGHRASLSGMAGTSPAMTWRECARGAPDFAPLNPGYASANPPYFSRRTR